MHTALRNDTSSSSRTEACHALAYFDDAIFTRISCKDRSTRVACLGLRV